MTARKNLPRRRGLTAVPAPKSPVEPAGGVHERRDELDRHAAANATVAGLFRRAFMRGVR